MRIPGWVIGAVLAAIAAAWWFVLRIGPRLEEDDVPTIAVADAAAYARSATLAPGPRHADLARSWAQSSAVDVEVLPEGRVFFPRMLADISRARHSIHIMQYGFTPGTVADAFAPMLVAKAREGVAVRVIIDAVGSWAYTRSRHMLAALSDAGVEVMLHDFVPPDRSGPVGRRRFVRSADQAGRVEHRKIVLVDGEIAYIGGAGIEDHFENGLFHDVYVRVTGPVTRQVQALYLATFGYHGGTLASDDGALESYFPAVADEGPYPVRVLMNWPRGWRPLTEAASELINGAKERLDMHNPYIGDARLIREIVDAANRGVAVRMVVSDEAHGNGVAYAAFKHHYDALLGAGAQIWEYPALVHAKVIVADDRVLVGTLNLDSWSMYRNPELGLLFDHPDVAEQFRTVLIEPDIAASVPGQAATGGLRRARNRIYARADYLL